nr:MAG TPA: hypothetical protein [Caudoviricetes sp.]
MKIRISQQTQICPICGRPFAGAPAISRIDGVTRICPDCGTRQALGSIGIEPSEQEKIIKTIREHTRNL